MKLRTVQEVVDERRLAPNDCQACKNFEPATDGLAYGWCDPHKQYVKLHHAAGTFYSQCRFKGIRHPKREAA